MNYKIKQIEKSDVMKMLLNDRKVYRLNVENECLTDLEKKTIETIKRDMKQHHYLYFVVECESPCCRTCKHYEYSSGCDMPLPCEDYCSWEVRDE